jgi:hypothetical protein
MRFELWRQEDNGSHFLDGSFPNRVAAEVRLAELRVRHKQVYWITERSHKEE